MPRPLIRRSQPDLEPEPEEVEEEEVHGEEAEEEERASRAAALEKVIDRIQDIETNDLVGRRALCLAVVEYVGATGSNGVTNGSGDLLEQLAEDLIDRGIEEYSAEYLRGYRTMAEIPAELWDLAEELCVAFTILYESRYHPEKLRDMLAALKKGTQPAGLKGLTQTFQGEEVPLATAIRRRGRITKSDVRIALGQKTAGYRQPASGGSKGAGQGAISDLTAEQEEEITKKVLADPERAVEVLAERETRSALRQAINEAEHNALEKTLGPADPERVKESQNISGPAGMGFMLVTMTEIVEYIEEADKAFERLEAESNQFRNPKDPDLVETADLVFDKAHALSIRADLVRSSIHDGVSDQDIRSFMEGGKE